MNLSTQKLAIDERAAYLQKLIDCLKSSRQILIVGMEAIDNGRDMHGENSILAQEVRKIMKTDFLEDLI